MAALGRFVLIVDHGRGRPGERSSRSSCDREPPFLRGSGGSTRDALWIDRHLRAAPGRTVEDILDVLVRRYRLGAAVDVLRQVADPEAL